MPSPLASLCSLSLALGLAACSSDHPPLNDGADTDVPDPALADAATDAATTDSTTDAALDAMSPDSDPSIDDLDAGPAIERQIVLGIGVTEWNESGTMSTYTFTPYVDGQDVDLEWGAQGGIMVTPTIRLSGDGWTDASLTTITLSHAPAPGHEDAFRIENREALFRIDPSVEPAPGGAFVPQFLEEDGMLFIPRIYDQLAGDVHDSWVRLTVTIEVGRLHGEASIDLHLFDPTNRPACEIYEPESAGGPCRDRFVPFTATVDSIRAGEPDWEGSPTSIVRYTASASAEAVACEPTLGEGTTAERTLSNSVREAEGVEAGAMLAAFRRVAAGYSCGGGDVFAFERTP